MKKRFSQEQIAFALRQEEGGVPVAEILRRLGVSEATFYRWKKKYGGLGVAKIRRLKQLEDENKRHFLRFVTTTETATARWILRNVRR